MDFFTLQQKIMTKFVAKENYCRKDNTAMWKSNICKLLIVNSLLTAGYNFAHANNYTEQNQDRQSLVWEQIPYQWNEGAFLGNGIVGMVVYVDSTDNSLTLQLCRPDVTDHRKANEKKTSLGEMGANVMFDFCRLDVGKIKLTPKSHITGGNMKLNIYSGLLTGTLYTQEGNIDIKIFTPYDKEVNIIEYKSATPLECKLIPGNPQSPRVQVFPWTKKEQNYEDNPLPYLSQSPDEGYCVQRLLAGGDYATFWERQKENDSFTVYISTANEVPQSGLSLNKARQNVKSATNEGISALTDNTIKWWQQYQGNSFISIPDKKLENFYAIQMYKLATCSNPKGPAMDNFGTFFKMSQWPGMWWNLNVQLTYQSTYPNNKMAQAENFQSLMDEYFVKIIQSIATQKAGDYGWALHNYYLYLRYSGANDIVYKKMLCPKIKALLKIYDIHLKKSGNQFVLNDMESPEYEGFKTYDNSNYNLAVLRWLIQTLIKYESAKDKDVVKWKEIIWKLPDCPTDENGMMIAQDKPLNKSHRHYSHLLAFYPLHIMNVDDPAIKALAEKSIEHWLTIGNGKELAGYSYTGSASLYALLNNGEKAYRQLSHFINEPIGISLLLPNTLYVESDGKNPVIETPLSASTALAEMMLQSWGDKIRIFPAIPASWRTCCFSNLRAEGGFSVSAQRDNGRTKWVKIDSDNGKFCRLYIPEWTNCFVEKEGKTTMIKKVDGTFNIKLKKGESILLTDYKNANEASFTFAPAATDGSNFYGVKKGHGLKYRMDWPEVKTKWQENK